MHQSRKTHNAHNETQRRLRNLARKEWRYVCPHYYITHFYDDGSVKYTEPCWNYLGSWAAPMKTHFPHKGIRTVEDCEFARKHSFYTRQSKSKSSYWRWAKKRLHRIWRRKPIDELTFTYKDAVGCSLYDLW